MNGLAEMDNGPSVTVVSTITNSEGLNEEPNLPRSLNSLGRIDSSLGVKTELYNLCEQASNETSWKNINEWLLNHPEEARDAVEYLGETACSPLHLVCQKNPPFELIEILLTLAPQTAEWTDIYGWLPLHHACANGSSDQVISFLIDFYPQSASVSDKRCRTPLHF